MYTSEGASGVGISIITNDQGHRFIAKRIENCEALSAEVASIGIGMIAGEEQCEWTVYSGCKVACEGINGDGQCQGKNDGV